MISPATELGKYRLLRRVGVGGMAEVYEAELSGAAGFSKRLALKVMLPHWQQEPEMVRAFIDEARIVARLSHPNIVPVYDFGEIDGVYFLAMEYVDGWDLADVLRRCQSCGQHLSPAAAAYIVKQLAEALHYIHTRDEGIVHRDVSPHNVFLARQGHVRLADFGVAKAAARLSQTASGMIKGKLAYLAPEQVKGGEVGPRADVYAAGTVLFEILTARRYNPGLSELDLLHHAQHPVFRPPSALCPEAAPLDEVVRSALQPHPAQRTRDAALLAQHLGRFLEANPFDAGDLAVVLAMLGNEGPGLAASQAPAARPPAVGADGIGVQPGQARDGVVTAESAVDGLRTMAPSIETETLDLPGALTGSSTCSITTPHPGPATHRLVASLHRRRWLWLVAALAAVLPAALLIPGLGWRRAPPVQAELVSPRRLDAGTASPARQPAARPEPRVDAGPAGLDGTSLDVQLQYHRTRLRTLAVGKRLSRIVHKRRVQRPIARAKPDPVQSKPVVAAPTARPAAGASRQRLQELAAAARQRGLWPGDDREIDRLRREASEAVERGEGELALRRLAEQIEAFRIDQAFIKRKLGRLEQAMNRPGRTEEQRRQLSLGAQEVLKLALANQLVEASRQISRLLSVR